MSESHKCHCCPPVSSSSVLPEVSRRLFLSGMASGGALLAGLNWSTLSADTVEGGELPQPSDRKPLLVQPVLIHDLPQRQEGTSWRNWGGVDSQEAADEEAIRISKELESIKQTADFPVEFFPVLKMTSSAGIWENENAKRSQVVIVYGAGANINGIENLTQDVIIFQRWKSGPVYLQYEIVSPRFLRQHTDDAVLTKITAEDVVTDSLEELTWRLRSLCGLHNTKNTRIVTIGRPDIWSQKGPFIDEVMGRLKQQWGLDCQCVPYSDLEKMLTEAYADDKVVARAKLRTIEYLSAPGTVLETERDFVERCFVLESVFRSLLKKADSKALTILACMGTIMQVSKTSACLTLSLLNDAGYQAFCESDFAVIPSGILLNNISGKPVFLNDPTFPHDHIITLAHCTGPRRMDGKNLEPARIVTHFESDYGATPKVEMKLGTVCTNIAPDFASKRWVGLRGEVVDNPFKPICRTQIDVQYKCPDSLVANRMPGFHWMFAYGDYMRELGYALRRLGIVWEDLDKVPSTEYV